MLFGFLVVIYVLVCIFLCLLVLIQSDKGGGLSGALGGGMSNASALLGAQDTANILTRATTICASAFMALCVVITLIVAHGNNTQGSQSVLQKRAEELGEYAPSNILQSPLQLDGEAGGATDAGANLLPIVPLDDQPAGGNADGAVEGTTQP